MSYKKILKVISCLSIFLIPLILVAFALRFYLFSNKYIENLSIIEISRVQDNSMIITQKIGEHFDFLERFYTSGFNWLMFWLAIISSILTILSILVPLLGFKWFESL